MCYKTRTLSDIKGASRPPLQCLNQGFGDAPISSLKYGHEQSPSLLLMSRICPFNGQGNQILEKSAIIVVNKIVCKRSTSKLDGACNRF